MRLVRVALSELLGKDLAQQAAQATERQLGQQQGQVTDVVDGEETVLRADLAQSLHRQMRQGLHFLLCQGLGELLRLVGELPEGLAIPCAGAHRRGGDNGYR
jgi:hypothetical protein